MQSREVLDMDRSEAVVAATADGEDGQVSKEPRDVVEEDVVVAEDHCGSEYRMGETALGQGTLDEGFPSKVGVGRLDRRVGDTEVHDSLHTGAEGGAEQGAAVCERLLVGEGAVGEAHPIGVVESGHSAEVGFETRGVGEVQRPDVDGR